MRRQEARESFMQMLYQMDMQRDFSRTMKEQYLEFNKVDGNQQAYFNHLYDLAAEHLQEIDQALGASSSNWKIERIGKVDLAILRLAAVEILYDPDIPVNVSVNEAVELAKKFGSEDSGRFVNGVLGKVVRENSNESDKDVSGN